MRVLRRSRPNDAQPPLIVNQIDRCIRKLTAVQIRHRYAHSCKTQLGITVRTREKNKLAFLEIFAVRDVRLMVTFWHFLTFNTYSSRNKQARIVYEVRGAYKSYTQCSKTPSYGGRLTVKLRLSSLNDNQHHDKNYAISVVSPYTLPRIVNY